MGVTDDILKKFNLKYEDLTSAERDTLADWSKTLDSGNVMTISHIRHFVHTLKVSVEQELDKERKRTPKEFMSLLALFIPFYGLVKKWYQDEHRLYLEARLSNLILIESFLIGPKRAKEALTRAINAMARIRK